MQSLRPVRGMHWNRLFAMRLSGTLGEVRIRLAAVIGLVSLGLCATGSAQTGDAQSALVEAQRLEGAGNPAAALESYRWALDASRPESPERATALLGMATVETAQGNYPDARRHAADASRLFDRLRDPVRASLSLNRQGLAALNAGDYDEAGEMFAAALERSTKAAFLEGQTEQLGNLANVQFYLGRYADAGHLYEQAIALTQSARSSEPWVARRRWVLLANQATLFQRLGRDQEALAVYHELGTSNELRPRERAQMLVNLGVLYRHLGDPVKALNTYDEAGKLFARDHDVDGELNTVKNRGIVLALDLGRLDEAERSFTSALETATRLGNRRELLHDRLYRGETLLRTGNQEPAREDFAAALDSGTRAAHSGRGVEGPVRAGSGGCRSPRARIAHFEEAVTTIEKVREIDSRAIAACRIPERQARGVRRVDCHDASDQRRQIRCSHSSNAATRASGGNGFSSTSQSTLAQVQRALPDETLLLDYWNSSKGSAVIAVSRQRAGVFPIVVDEAQIRTLHSDTGRGAIGHLA